MAIGNSRLMSPASFCSFSSEQSARAHSRDRSADHSIIVTLGLAVPTFLYYNFHGFASRAPSDTSSILRARCGGFRGSSFPIEIVSHLARVMSLSVRLYANMFAGDLVTLVFFSLIPVGIPVIFLGLHLFVSLIQAFVFMLLTMIYLSLAVAHEH